MTERKKTKIRLGDIIKIKDEYLHMNSGWEGDPGYLFHEIQTLLLVDVDKESRELICIATIEDGSTHPLRLQSRYIDWFPEEVC